MDEQKIIELYWSRDEAAIKESESKYGKYCFTVSYNILHSHEDAEECVNDTFLSAWNAIPPALPRRLAVFFGRITRNLSLNRLKSYSAAKRGGSSVDLALSELEECIPAAATVEQALDEAATVKLINGFLLDLPEQKRNIFIRRYWYLYPIRDIAKQYNMTESNVQSVLFRMRNELKALLEKEETHL